MAIAADRDFERMSIPLLRLFWPSLVHPPKMKKYDNAGIDLVAYNDNSSIAAAVQCKGFYSNRELMPAHYRQIKSSIESFKASEFNCTEFVLLHNRTSSEKDIVDKIKNDLAGLVRAGKAERVRLWDRQTFLRDARERLEALIVERLRAEFHRLLEQISRLFRFGTIHVPMVPVTERRLVLKRWLPPVIEEVKSSDERISQLIRSAKGARWTLLTGVFGTGKSTAVLHAAIESTALVIFARCADMCFDSGGIGTNLLLRGVLQSLHLFDDLDDEDRNSLERLAGPALRVALSRPETEALLILDGLDENWVFSKSAGMTALANALTELRCPIVMTTRQEHFDATFGNFDQVVGDLTQKAGASQSARLLRLDPWTDGHVIRFFERAAQASFGTQRTRIEETLAQMKGGGSLPWPNELLHHPLFLQMIAELAADGNAGTRSAADTIGEWAMRKIARDVAVPRLIPIDIIDRTNFVNGMMLAMENIAGRMLTLSDLAYEFLETIDSELVVSEVSLALKAGEIDIAAVTGTSLLVPVSERRSAHVPVKFCHRTFQEYFTARHAQRTGIDPMRLPEPVRRLLADLNRGTG